SAIVFAPNSTRLLVASWSRNVTLYDIKGVDGHGTVIQTYPHKTPVLDVCYGANDDEAFSASVDGQVNRYEKQTRAQVDFAMGSRIWALTSRPRINLASGEQTLLSKHSAAVRNVVYSPDFCTFSFLRFPRPLS